MMIRLNWRLPLLRWLARVARRREAATMTKAELVRRMAQGAAITQPQAAHALRALLESVQLAPRQGARVTLAGFGTCAVRSRAARKGRDRRTGQDLLVPACKLPRFTTGKRLRAAILSR